MSERANRLTALLTREFHPDLLEVVDESSHHAGHAGARPGGETHFAVLMVSTRFEGASRVARSRLVHEALQSEFQSGLHALTLTLRTTAEHVQKSDTSGIVATGPRMS